MDIQKAPDISRAVRHILAHVPFTHVDPKRIICIRSYRATSRARARIWSFPRVWQLALSLPAYYVIEVLSEHFDDLSREDQSRVLIHELMHIPKNFSGSLVPHRGRRSHIDRRTVEKIYQIYKNYDYAHSRR